ncbi:hypothetical protein ACLBOM_33550 [Escherichia coli]
MSARYPHIKQVGLCHSVQGTAEELARDLNIDPATLRYRCAGINHMAFYLELERKTADGSYVNLYPELLAACIKQGRHRSRIFMAILAARILCATKCSKSWATSSRNRGRHFAEYTPWFIKPGREDLIERYKVPLDEYPKRCVEQLANWHKELEEYKNASGLILNRHGNMPAQS